MQYQKVIFSSPVQSEFFKTMNAALPHLDSSQRIFQVNEVWVDQKTLTISLRPGYWMSPHSLDCYSKILNTNQLFRGRQGLIPNTDVITHIVQREDTELLMRPLLDHSDPICRDILSEGRVGFSLDRANLVHLPCFNDKQLILISTNLESGRYFDTMNLDGSGQDKFTTIISTVTYNFKTLFALTYPNCTAFNIKDFDYRFVAVPRTHFRYDTGLFLLQIVKNYRRMGVPGFSTADLQALHEIFLYKISTYPNSEVQLPIGFRSFK
ncbi:uncharacterized protein [Aegilops tauschii subsp. strangulata]